MTRSNPAITLLFWFMFAIGGLSFALGLVLPPWHEYRVARQQLEAAEQRRASLQLDLVALERRIDHLQNDPAYLQRVVQKEFGLEARESGEAVTVQLTALPTSAPSAANAERKVAAIVEEAAQTHPVVRLYAVQQTRPYVMAMSAGLVAAAIFLLGRNTRQAAG